MQDTGARFVSGVLVLMVSRSPDGRRRLGVTVSSRVGNAVVRSKVKRRFREIFRRNRSLLPAACDVVMIARSGADQITFQELMRLFEAAAEKARRKFSLVAADVGVQHAEPSASAPENPRTRERR